MDVDEYPITNSVFEHWFNSRLARKESEKGDQFIAELCRDYEHRSQSTTTSETGHLDKETNNV